MAMSWDTNVVKAAAPDAATLSANFDVQLKRLSALVDNAEQYADAIHGPQPTGTAQSGEGRPVASIASRVRDLGQLNDALEMALMRIGGGL